jgi:type VII secretion protein EccB
MAARRDELNAYTFARKRTVAAFLKPGPFGSIENAPRPIRVMVPSIVVGALVVAGFGAYGMLKPALPQGWKKPATQVLVGDKSTTRYIVLKSGTKDADGKDEVLLHPVLNLASARLLTKNNNSFTVTTVDEDLLDKSGIRHGATVGIPYAPDRLPSKDNANKPKVWALCEQPGAGGDQQTQKAVFVLGGKDVQKVHGNGRLLDGQAMYVQDPEHQEYLVDSQGTAYSLGTESTQDHQALIRALFNTNATPQRVTDDWMATLNKGQPIVFPTVDGAGETSSGKGVPSEHKVVGTVLTVEQPGGGTSKYVVLRNGLAPVSNFVAGLLLGGPNAKKAYGDQKPDEIGVANYDVGSVGDTFLDSKHWPTESASKPANDYYDDGGNKTVCSVYNGPDAATSPLSTWVGKKYPAPIANGGTSAYVTPGDGLFYRQVTSQNSSSGSLFLVTDTGLRYSVPAGNDNGDKSGKANQDVNQAQILLGYGDIKDPVKVPKVWSSLLSMGPTLDRAGAQQEQTQ